MSQQLNLWQNTCQINCKSLVYLVLCGKTNTICWHECYTFDIGEHKPTFPRNPWLWQITNFIEQTAKLDCCLKKCAKCCAKWLLKGEREVMKKQTSINKCIWTTWEMFSWFGHISALSKSDIFYITWHPSANKRGDFVQSELQWLSQDRKARLGVILNPGESHRTGTHKNT